MSVFLVWIVGFLKELDALFFGIGLFRLLIQRCKNVTGWGSLFDKGGDWLDESKICPTNGFLLGGWPLATLSGGGIHNKAAAGISAAAIFLSGDLSGFSGSGFE
jgi:hypothetical protein